jgi:hypothetical protein
LQHQHTIFSLRLYFLRNNTTTTPTITTTTTTTTTNTTNTRALRVHDDTGASPSLPPGEVVFGGDATGGEIAGGEVLTGGLVGDDPPPPPDPEPLELPPPPDEIGVQIAVIVTLRAGIIKVVVALLDNDIPPSFTVHPEKV